MKSRALFCCYLLVALALCQGSCQAAEVTFIARTADGKQVRGPLYKLSSDWSVEIGQGTRHKIPGSDLVCLRQKDLPLPPLPTDEHILLANGDRLSVQEPRLADEKLFFRHKILGGDAELSLPLSAVAMIWRAAPDRIANPEHFRRRLAAGRRPRDRVLLRNGDTLEGNLTALGAGNVGIEVGKKIVTTRWTQVAAIALSTELAERLQPKGIHAKIVLAEPDNAPGGRFTLTSASCEDGVFRGKTVFGALVRFPVERIAQLEILGGKAVRLVDLPPAKYEYLPFLDKQSPWTKDGNVEGSDFRLDGSTWDQGVGMRAHSLLHYPLNGAFRRFEALVGLDDKDGTDRYGGEGRVRVRVLLDGKPLDLGKRDVLVQSDGPLKVGVSVEGGKTLTLEVDYAGNGPVLAVVDWVDARLIK